ncbi:hypothetical protein TNCT_624111 [Trichonephila clavata]|uniref:Uncharacterized protein n=1 Tax=Trichonephila clavata TaxID=2740835 RepID=A0A8X6GFS4_TRICU|nr:hypothetical protein TNCT_624111 [Trichonephila clavata]
MHVGRCTVWTELSTKKNPVLLNISKFFNDIILAHVIGRERFDDLSFEYTDRLLAALREIIDVVNYTVIKDGENLILNVDLIKEGLELVS